MSADLNVGTRVSKYSQMSIDLLALSSISGLPLFARRVTSKTCRRGDDGSSPSTPEDATSLNTITTLFGINLFSRLHKCELQSAESADGHVKIRWRSFNENIVMIVMTDDDQFEEYDLVILFQLAFDSMLMMCGTKQLADENVERLKQNLKTAHTLIDYILNCYCSGGVRRLELMTSCVNYAFASRSSYINSLPNSIAKMAKIASNTYIALFVQNKLLSLSQGWWSKLHGVKDLFMISYLLNSLPLYNDQRTIEMCIYPFCSGHRDANRLMIRPITKGTVLCMVLGVDQPSLQYLEQDIFAFLNDAKWQDEKLSRHIFELRNTKNISRATFTEIFGKQTPIVNDLAAFVIIDLMQKLLLVYNENLIELHHEEIITFCELGSTEQRHNETIIVSDSHMMCRDMIDMYRLCNRNLVICVLFEAGAKTLKQMRSVAVALVDTFAKAKHFWP